MKSCISPFRASTASLMSSMIACGTFLRPAELLKSRREHALDLHIAYREERKPFVSVPGIDPRITTR